MIGFEIRPESQTCRGLFLLLQRLLLGSAQRMRKGCYRDGFKLGTSFKRTLPPMSAAAATGIRKFSFFA